jgi:hypothetical protein
MAKPIKGTKQDDLNILGTNGNDTLQGKDGNDFITGGKRNDSIDGGNGIDTAIFTGNFADYLIAVKGTGNDKITVTDTVLNRDGTDQLKHVEFMQFADALVDVQSNNAYFVNAEVDESAQKPGTEDIISGSGIPATGFGIVKNLDSGIELGLQVIYRQGPTVTSTDDYNDGVLHFSVNDGAQSTANGSSVNNAGRAAWSFDFSIATGLNGATTDLDDYTFQLLYDVDPGAGTSYRTLALEPGGSGSSGHQWRDQGTGLVFIADDSGNSNVTQNSENYAFTFFQSFLTSAYGPGSGFAGPAHFDIVLQALDGSRLIAANHIAVDVIL